MHNAGRLILICLRLARDVVLYRSTTSALIVKENTTRKTRELRGFVTLLYGSGKETTSSVAICFFVRLAEQTFLRHSTSTIQRSSRYIT